MTTLDATFAALADPTRRAILAALARGERSVTELAEPFRMSMPAISKHLKVLEKAGLIERSRDAQMRPARLNAAALKTAAAWINQYQQFWEESFDRLEDYLKILQADKRAKTNATEAESTKPKQRRTGGLGRRQPPAAKTRSSKEGN